MWTSVVELGDALTREQKLEKRMYRLAIEQVFTDEQWSAILWSSIADPGSMGR